MDVWPSTILRDFVSVRCPPARARRGMSAKNRNFPIFCSFVFEQYFACPLVRRALALVRLVARSSFVSRFSLLCVLLCACCCVWLSCVLLALRAMCSEVAVCACLVVR